MKKRGAIQFEVRAAVQLRKEYFLRAGYSANADIVLDRKDSVLAIKESNILFEEDKTFVEIAMGDQQFEKKEIRTGISDGINIEVLDGLSKETQIKKL